MSSRLRGAGQALLSDRTHVLQGQPPRKQLLVQVLHADARLHSRGALALAHTAPARGRLAAARVYAQEPAQPVQPDQHRGRVPVRHLDWRKAVPRTHRFYLQPLPGGIRHDSLQLSLASGHADSRRRARLPSVPVRPRHASRCDQR